MALLLPTLLLLLPPAAFCAQGPLIRSSHVHVEMDGNGRVSTLQTREQEQSRAESNGIIRKAVFLDGDGTVTEPLHGHMVGGVVSSEASEAEIDQEKNKVFVGERAHNPPKASDGSGGYPEQAAPVLTTTTLTPVPDKAAMKACADKMKAPCGQQWAFVVDSKRNLVAIKKGPKTGSGKTEVHRLTAASNYKTFDLQTPTGLHLTNENWDFVMDSKDNLVAIVKGPITGSGKTEVHRLTAASNYNKFDLQTGTALHLTNENWDFVMDSKDDLVAIVKGPITGSGKTEVHRLSKSSNYQKFNLQMGTAQHYTNGADWAFAMAGKDLMMILKGPASGSCMTEVHTLSGAGNYQKFDLHTGTGLELSAPSSCNR